MHAEVSTLPITPKPSVCIVCMCLCTCMCVHAHLCGGQKSTSGCFPPNIFRQALTEPAARIYLFPFPEPLTTSHPPGVTEAGHHTRVLRSSFEQKALDPLSHFLTHTPFRVFSKLAFTCSKSSGVQAQLETETNQL